MRTSGFVMVAVGLVTLTLKAQAVCWDQVYSEQTAQQLLKVDFVSDQLGWAVRSSGLGSGSILHTVDGGETWTVQYSTSYRLENIDFADANNGLAVGYYSIFRTTNGGLTWTRTNVDHATMLGVSFGDANNAWVVGDDLAGGDSPIWHTADGGASWSAQSSGTIYGLNEVAFANSTTGVAVGLGGIILNTTNGGGTWVNRPSGTSYALNGVSLVNEIFGCAVGVHGTILFTSNSGGSWTPVTSGTTAALYDISFCDDDGWVTGDSSLILYTPNAGFTWSRELSRPSIYPLLIGVACYGSEAWAVGFNSGSQNVVFRNTCPVPQHLVVHFSPDHWIGHFYVPAFLGLNWEPVADSGTVNYNVYTDSLVNGSYQTLVGTTADTSYGIWWGGADPRRYYLVKTATP